MWVSFEWINHNMRNNRICYVSCLQGEAMFFPNYGFSLGLQPHPTLSRGVVVLWFRLPTQSFRRTVLVFTNFLTDIYEIMWLHSNKPTLQMFTDKLLTGKSFSDALILAPVNPQYDERLFIEFQEKYKFTTCCVQILFWMSKQKQKNNFCTQHVLKLSFSGEFNEQSLVILWVNWCKNEGFWKRFTYMQLEES